MDENKPTAPADTDTDTRETPAQLAERRKKHVEDGLLKCKRNGWVDRTLLTLQFNGLDEIESEDARALIEALGHKRFAQSPPDLKLSPAELNALHFEAVRLRIVKAAK